MKIEKMSANEVKRLFKEYDVLECPRDKAYKQVEIMNAFHCHYTNIIDIILAVAGEIQKHKEAS